MAGAAMPFLPTGVAFGRNIARKQRVREGHAACIVSGMARRHRIRIPGLSQHIVQRGNNRMDIFRCSDDYEVFFALAREAASATGMDINSYVFMRNHVHMLVTPQHATAVEKAMHAIDTQYAQYMNRRYKRSGAAFDGRYRPAIIDTERYWYACMRYVELNPVRAGIVSDPRSYFWSSYSAHAFGSPDALVTFHPLYLALGPTPNERQECWRRHCGGTPEPAELDTIRQTLRVGGVLGTVVIPEEH